MVEKQKQHFMIVLQKKITKFIKRALLFFQSNQSNVVSFLFKSPDTITLQFQITILGEEDLTNFTLCDLPFFLINIPIHHCCRHHLLWYADYFTLTFSSSPFTFFFQLETVSVTETLFFVGDLNLLPNTEETNSTFQPLVNQGACF